MDALKYVKSLADTGRNNQKVSSNDYRNDRGILVCGTCGENKETLLDISSIKGLASQKKFILVPCMCKCDREAEKREHERIIKQEEAERINRLRKASLIDKKFEEARFENFTVNKDNQVNLNRCRKYAENFAKMAEKNQGLLLWGNIGTGKSYAASCIANYLLDRGTSVIMTSFTKILSICGFGGENEESEIIDRLKTVKLVIFDDMGTERSTDYAMEKIYNIIDSRYRAKLPMIITTNSTLDGMLNEQDLRFSKIYDRIFEVCFPMQFTGKSWRKKQAYKRTEEMMAFIDGE